MKLKSFRKGVHPYDGKELSADCPIKAVQPQGEMVYPVAQSMGNPAVPCVEKGERVLKGQCVAVAGAGMSVPVHSSVSGTVKAVEKRLAPSGSRVMSVVVENDGLDEAVVGFSEKRDYEKLSGEEIVKIIVDSGIAGLGGAGFPTAVKLTPPNPQNIDTLIINGAECEPYLTSDSRLMTEKAKDIIKGVKIILRLFQNAGAVVGIEKNKPDSIKAMNDAAAGEDAIAIAPLKTKYPQGGEKQLIYAITGRKLNSRLLPSDRGCIVVNVATCYAIYEAVCLNMPLIHRVMTITGEGVNTPCNLDVPIGMSHSAVLAAAGGAREDAVKFISGGPMMGVAMGSLEVPVIKTSSSILAFSKDGVAAAPQSACIHCGKCVSVCPQLLIPQMMCKSVKSEDFERFADLGGMECIECGCCTFVCPAKIPLTQMFRLGKTRVREFQRKI